MACSSDGNSSKKNNTNSNISNRNSSPLEGNKAKNVTSTSRTFIESTQSSVGFLSDEINNIRLGSEVGSEIDQTTDLANQINVEKEIMKITSETIKLNVDTRPNKTNVEYKTDGKKSPSHDTTKASRSSKNQSTHSKHLLTNKSYSVLSKEHADMKRVNGKTDRKGEETRKIANSNNQDDIDVLKKGNDSKKDGASKECSQDRKRTESKADSDRHRSQSGENTSRNHKSSSKERESSREKTSRQSSTDPRNTREDSSQEKSSSKDCKNRSSHEQDTRNSKSSDQSQENVSKKSEFVEKRSLSNSTDQSYQRVSQSSILVSESNVSKNSKQNSNENVSRELLNSYSQLADDRHLNSSKKNVQKNCEMEPIENGEITRAESEISDGPFNGFDDDSLSSQHAEPVKFTCTITKNKLIDTCDKNDRVIESDKRCTKDVTKEDKANGSENIQERHPVSSTKISKSVRVDMTNNEPPDKHKKADKRYEGKSSEKKITKKDSCTKDSPSELAEGKSLKSKDKSSGRSSMKHTTKSSSCDVGKTDKSTDYERYDKKSTLDRKSSKESHSKPDEKNSRGVKRKAMSDPAERSSNKKSCAGSESKELLMSNEKNFESVTEKVSEQKENKNSKGKKQGKVDDAKLRHKTEKENSKKKMSKKKPISVEDSHGIAGENSTISRSCKVALEDSTKKANKKETKKSPEATKTVKAGMHVVESEEICQRELQLYNKNKPYINVNKNSILNVEDSLNVRVVIEKVGKHKYKSEKKLSTPKIKKNTPKAPGGYSKKKQIQELLKTISNRGKIKSSTQSEINKHSNNTNSDKARDNSADNVDSPSETCFGEISKDYHLVNCGRKDDKEARDFVESGSKDSQRLDTSTDTSIADERNAPRADDQNSTMSRQTRKEIEQENTDQITINEIEAIEISRLQSNNEILQQSLSNDPSKFADERSDSSFIINSQRRQIDENSLGDMSSILSTANVVHTSRRPIDENSLGDMSSVLPPGNLGDIDHRPIDENSLGYMSSILPPPNVVLINHKPIDESSLGHSSSILSPGNVDNISHRPIDENSLGDTSSIIPPPNVDHIIHRHIDESSLGNMSSVIPPPNVDHINHRPVDESSLGDSSILPSGMEDRINHRPIDENSLGDMSSILSTENKYRGPMGENVGQDNHKLIDENSLGDMSSILNTTKDRCSDPRDMDENSLGDMSSIVSVVPRIATDNRPSHQVSIGHDSSFEDLPSHARNQIENSTPPIDSHNVAFDQQSLGEESYVQTEPIRELPTDQNSLGDESFVEDTPANLPNGSSRQNTSADPAIKTGCNINEKSSENERSFRSISRGPDSNTTDHQNNTRRVSFEFSTSHYASDDQESIEVDKPIVGNKQDSTRRFPNDQESIEVDSSVVEDTQESTRRIQDDEESLGGMSSIVDLPNQTRILPPDDQNSIGEDISVVQDTQETTRRLPDDQNSLGVLSSIVETRKSTWRLSDDQQSLGEVSSVADTQELTSRIQDDEQSIENASSIENIPAATTRKMSSDYQRSTASSPIPIYKGPLYQEHLGLDDDLIEQSPPQSDFRMGHNPTFDENSNDCSTVVEVALPEPSSQRRSSRYSIDEDKNHIESNKQPNDRNSLRSASYYEEMPESETRQDPDEPPDPSRRDGNMFDLNNINESYDENSLGEESYLFIEVSEDVDGIGCDDETANIENSKRDAIENCNRIQMDAECTRKENNMREAAGHQSKEHFNDENSLGCDSSDTENDTRKGDAPLDEKLNDKITMSKEDINERFLNRKPLEVNSIGLDTSSNVDIRTTRFLDENSLGEESTVEVAPMSEQDSRFGLKFDQVEAIIVGRTAVSAQNPVSRQELFAKQSKDDRSRRVDILDTTEDTVDVENRPMRRHDNNDGLDSESGDETEFGSLGIDSDIGLNSDVISEIFDRRFAKKRTKAAHKRARIVDNCGDDEQQLGKRKNISEFDLPGENEIDNLSNQAGLNLTPPVSVNKLPYSNHTLTSTTDIELPPSSGRESSLSNLFDTVTVFSNKSQQLSTITGLFSGDVSLSDMSAVLQGMPPSTNTPNRQNSLISNPTDLRPSETSSNYTNTLLPNFQIEFQEGKLKTTDLSTDNMTPRTQPVKSLYSQTSQNLIIQSPHNSLGSESDDDLPIHNADKQGPSHVNVSTYLESNSCHSTNFVSRNMQPELKSPLRTEHKTTEFPLVNLTPSSQPMMVTASKANLATGVNIPLSTTQCTTTNNQFSSYRDNRSYLDDEEDDAEDNTQNAEDALNDKQTIFKSTPQFGNVKNMSVLKTLLSSSYKQHQTIDDKKSISFANTSDSRKRNTATPAIEENSFPDPTKLQQFSAYRDSKQTLDDEDSFIGGQSVGVNAVSCADTIYGISGQSQTSSKLVNQSIMFDKEDHNRQHIPENTQAPTLKLPAMSQEETSTAVPMKDALPSLSQGEDPFKNLDPSQFDKNQLDKFSIFGDSFDDSFPCDIYSIFDDEEDPSQPGKNGENETPGALEDDKVSIFEPSPMSGNPGSKKGIDPSFLFDSDEEYVPSTAKENTATVSNVLNAKRNLRSRTALDFGVLFDADDSVDGRTVTRSLLGDGSDLPDMKSEPAGSVIDELASVASDIFDGKEREVSRRVNLYATENGIDESSSLPATDTAVEERTIVDLENEAELTLENSPERNGDSVAADSPVGQEQAPATTPTQPRDIQQDLRKSRSSESSSRHIFNTNLSLDDLVDEPCSVEELNRRKSHDDQSIILSDDEHALRKASGKRKTNRSVQRQADEVSIFDYEDDEEIPPIMHRSSGRHQDVQTPVIQLVVDPLENDARKCEEQTRFFRSIMDNKDRLRALIEKRELDTGGEARKGNAVPGGSKGYTTYPNIDSRMPSTSRIRDGTLYRGNTWNQARNISEPSDAFVRKRNVPRATSDHYITNLTEPGRPVAEKKPKKIPDDDNNSLGSVSSDDDIIVTKKPPIQIPSRSTNHQEGQAFPKGRLEERSARNQSPMSFRTSSSSGSRNGVKLGQSKSNFIGDSPKVSTSSQLVQRARAPKRKRYDSLGADSDEDLPVNYNEKAELSRPTLPQYAETSYSRAEPTFGVSGNQNTRVDPKTFGSSGSLNTRVEPFLQAKSHTSKSVGHRNQGVVGHRDQDIYNVRGRGQHDPSTYKKTSQNSTAQSSRTSTNSTVTTSLRRPRSNSRSSLGSLSDDDLPAQNPVRQGPSNVYNPEPNPYNGGAHSLLSGQPSLDTSHATHASSSRLTNTNRVPNSIACSTHTTSQLSNQVSRQSFRQDSTDGRSTSVHRSVEQRSVQSRASTHEYRDPEALSEASGHSASPPSSNHPLISKESYVYYEMRGAPHSCGSSCVGLCIDADVEEDLESASIVGMRAMLAMEAMQAERKKRFEERQRRRSEKNRAALEERRKLVEKVGDVFE